MSKGKLLDTWHYEYKGTDEISDTVLMKKVAIELRLIKEFDGDTPPLNVKEVWFTTKCREADIELTGTDIEVLRAAMWDRLDKRYETKWEQYYLVEIEPSRVYDGYGTGLTFRYRDVDKGTAWDGTLILRERRYGRGEHHFAKWPGAFTSKASGKVIACIPATQYNRECLKEFAGRIDILREALSKLLEPAVILKTLAGVTGLNMLPAMTTPEEVVSEATIDIEPED